MIGIQIDTMRTPITVDEGISILQRQTDSFGLFLDLDRLAEYHLYFLQQMNVMRARILTEHQRLRKLTNDEVIKYLISFMKVDSYKFRVESGEDIKMSFDKNIRASLSDDMTVSEDVREFVKTYSKYSEAKWLLGYLPQYYTCDVCQTLSYNGHRMVIAHPKWNKLNTNRISASYPSMQNIPRYMKDIITSPEGWVLRRADSDQIEPRITYSWYIPDELIKNLITLYNDAYAGIMEYTFMSAEDDILYRKDFSKYKKEELGDDFKNKRQEIKKLVLSANYGSGLASVDKTIGEAYKRRIVQHPLRLRREQEVKEQVMRGVEKFYTAFGNVIIPDETVKYKKGKKGWKGHVERCGINNPIQGTASDLMLYSISEAYKVIQDYPDTHIAFYKHDEGAFYVKEDDVLEVDKRLKNITAYNVRGWIPITCALEEGQLKSEEVPTVLC